MTIKEESDYKGRIYMYRAIIVVLIIVIFFLAEAYFGALNKYNDIYEQMETQSEEYESESFYAGKEEGYKEGYQDGYDAGIDE